ncbi:MAG: hypothetical protein WC829_03535 [Hyphomicrobium sp.]|jgi:hypothetical protein
MDAATLYIVMTVASGNKRMTTEKFPTIVLCEKAAQKLRQKTSMKETIFYCVKRKPDASERSAVARAAAAAAAAQRRQMQGAQQQQPQGAGPIGMPRDFYSGTTPPKQ